MAPAATKHRALTSRPRWNPSVSASSTENPRCVRMVGSATFTIEPSMTLGFAGALVGEVGEAVAHGLRVDQAQGSLVAGLAEQALARADRNREDGQTQLVDQVVLHQRAHERAAGVHDDRPLSLLLELRDLPNYLPSHDDR